MGCLFNARVHKMCVTHACTNKCQERTVCRYIHTGEGLANSVMNKVWQEILCARFVFAPVIGMAFSFLKGSFRDVEAK